MFPIDWQVAAGTVGQHHPKGAEPTAAEQGEQCWVGAGDLDLLRPRLPGQVCWDKAGQAQAGKTGWCVGVREAWKQAQENLPRSSGKHQEQEPQFKSCS